MSGPLEYAPMREEEFPSVVRLIHHAFAGPPEGCETWLRGAGLEHMRVLRDPATRSSPPACLLRIPMGQYFGGRSVPMLGIAGVAVAPEARGRGAGLRIMQEAIKECARDGAALSGLYASTQALYRQVGYEQAGHRFSITLPVHRILERGSMPKAPGDERITTRALTDADEPAIRTCYSTFAAINDGLLDRGPYCWARTRQLRDTTNKGFGFFNGGALEGYVFLNQSRKPDTGHHDVALSDMAFITPAAGRAIVKFLAGFSTVADNVSFFGGPLHPLLALLPQQHFEVSKRDYWMLRITNLRTALEARGYAAGIDAELGLEIRDDLVPENSGLWRLRVREGRGKVTQGHGPGPTLTTSISGLVPIFSGFWTPRQAALLGLAQGDATALETAAAIFAGGSPWMIEMF